MYYLFVFYNQHIRNQSCECVMNAKKNVIQLIVGSLTPEHGLIFNKNVTALKKMN